MAAYKGNDIITHNLFDYATSELSQDAFFCWLLSYSTKESKRDHSDLFKVSQRFLKRMLNENFNSDDVDYYVTNIERQKKAVLGKYKGYIDVFVTIETAEDMCYLIIEDKIDTWEHNQLEVYYKAVLEELKKKREHHNKLYVAFVKTEYMIHMEEAYMNKFKDSEIQHLKIMKQDELCEILEEELSVSNVILNDFVKKLKRKINREAFDIGMLDKNFEKESTLVYKFFDYLIQNKLRSQDKRQDSFCWCGYVNNARGGFHCLTWDVYKFDKKPFASMYLQMEVYPYDAVKEKSELRIALKLRAFEESDEDSALSSDLELQIKKLKNAINDKIQDMKDNAVFRYETKYFRIGHTMRAGYICFDINKYEEAMLQMETYIEEAVKVLSEN